MLRGMLHNIITLKISLKSYLSPTLCWGLQLVAYFCNYKLNYNNTLFSATLFFPNFFELHSTFFYIPWSAARGESAPLSKPSGKRLYPLMHKPRRCVVALRVPRTRGLLFHIGNYWKLQIQITLKLSASEENGV